MCGVFVFGPGFVIQFSMSFQVLQSSPRRRESWLFCCVLLCVCVCVFVSPNHPNYIYMYRILLPLDLAERVFRLFSWLSSCCSTTTGELRPLVLLRTGDLSRFPGE